MHGHAMHMQHGSMVLCCTDGNAGSSRSTKSVKYTLQELQGKTNKALMVRVSSTVEHVLQC